MTTTFDDLGLRKELVAALREQGLHIPTPVQQEAIPLLLEGRDAIVQAQTGTGKTFAFVLPALQRIDPEMPHTQALIVTPTRELAIQIHAEVRKLAPAAGVSALAVYGGQDVEAQIHRLQGTAQLIVATPGRLLDHLRRGTVSLASLSMLVLDEADQMLHFGFLNEVEDIIRQTPAERQTMLLSATMPGTVRKLAKSYLRSPADVRIRGRETTLEAICQIVVETTDRAKLQTLLDMLKRYRPQLAVLFCRTQIRVKKLTESLQTRGLNADELHGGLTQAQREDVMRRFREGSVQLLVATDVAARGLDIEGVTHVFNYDIPHDAESYIHRIGRTGRAGQSGFAFTLVAPRDSAYLQGIEHAIGTTLERKRDAEYRADEGPRTEAQRQVRGAASGLAHKRDGLTRDQGGRGSGGKTPTRGGRTMSPSRATQYGGPGRTAKQDGPRKGRGKRR